MNGEKIIIQRCKLLLIIALIGLLVCVVLSSCSCSRNSWFYQDQTFRRLLGSIPDPPGLISRDSINTEAYVPYGLRKIEIIGEYDEVVEFYRRELPQLDWRLMRDSEHELIPSWLVFLARTRCRIKSSAHRDVIEHSVGVIVDDLSRAAY